MDDRPWYPCEYTKASEVEGIRRESRRLVRERRPPQPSSPYQGRLSRNMAGRERKKNDGEEVQENQEGPRVPLLCRDTRDRSQPHPSGWECNQIHAKERAWYFPLSWNVGLDLGKLRNNRKPRRGGCLSSDGPAGIWFVFLHAFGRRVIEKATLHVGEVKKWLSGTLRESSHGCRPEFHIGPKMTDI